MTTLTAMDKLLFWLGLGAARKLDHMLAELRTPTAIGYSLRPVRGSGSLV
jgi:hypothetical protein